METEQIVEYLDQMIHESRAELNQIVFEDERLRVIHALDAYQRVRVFITGEPLPK